MKATQEQKSKHIPRTMSDMMKSRRDKNWSRKNRILIGKVVLHLNAQEVSHLDLGDVVGDVFVVVEAGTLDACGARLGVRIGLEKQS